MKNLLKLASFAGFCFAMIVFGACNSEQGGGGATVTVNGTAYTASGSASYTVTNGYTYVRTGTDTVWHLSSGTSTSTSWGVADPSGTSISTGPAPNN